MLINFAVTALRNIAKHKLYSFINIAGLAVGLACVTFVILFVRDELSWDRWIPNTANLYRVEVTVDLPDRPQLQLGVMPFPLPAAMRDESALVTGMARLYTAGMTLTAGDRQFRPQVNEVDPGFFDLVQLPLIAGDRGALLRQPDSIVLTKSLARKYFGDANPIGRLLVTGPGPCAGGVDACSTQPVSLRVTGVTPDLPHNSQLSGDAFIPNTSRADRTSFNTKQDWFSQGGWGYVRLAPGANPAALAASMKTMLDRNATPALHKFGIMRSGAQVYSIHLTPFARYHLEGISVPASNRTTLYGIVAIGVLVLLVACFNFTNLATARSMLRAREIALRKIVGAHRRQVIFQFLSEAVLTSLLSLIVALTMVEVLLPAFGRFLQRDISFHYSSNWDLVLALLGVAIAAGLLSGFYPALVLSRFRPAVTLRTGDKGQGGAGRLRTLLVVLQFAVSIGLGIAAMVVFSQTNYARNLDLGFRHDNVLIIASGKLTADGRETFAQTLRTNPGVIEVGQSDMLPFLGGQTPVATQVPGQAATVTLNRMVIDAKFLDVYGIKLVAGRTLSDTRAEDRMASTTPGDSGNEGHNMLVNETGARQLGFTAQGAVGKVVRYNGSMVRIVGVLADTRMLGAMTQAAPSAYIYIRDFPLTFSVRLRAEDLPQTLAFIDRTWHGFSPDAAILRQFIDDGFVRLYSDAERQGDMFEIFVAIAIFIACLGQFGLAAFTAGRRTKEIGVRKVFGARVFQIVWLLLAQFSTPVLLANLLAWPLAWYYLDHWLQGFAYRITLSPLYFLAAGAMALAIAWMTVLSHALQVARANPIHALRCE